MLLTVLLYLKKKPTQRKMLARSDPGPKMPTLGARRHQAVPPPDAAALPWDGNRFPAGMLQH